MRDDVREAWFRRFQPGRGATTTLLCLPHAGGSASFYFPLARSLASRVNVVAVQYPGRQDRRHEPFLTSIDAIADQVADLLATEPDGDIALFGHSMGATIAFETASRLEARGRTVRALLVSGQRAPSRHRSDDVHDRSDDGIMAELRALNGTGGGLLGDDEIARMILPAVRNDYTAVEAYRPAPGARVETPITAFAGEQDPRVLVPEVADWRLHTGGDFDIRVYPGGHFFLVDHQEDMSRRILAALRPSTVAATAS